MNAMSCLRKLERVGVLYFATVDENGSPQIRNISAIHYEPDGLYFFTARGKNFCKELLADGRVQIAAYTRYKESIRVSGTARPVPAETQAMWIDRIFTEQPYLSNVYPSKTRQIGIVFMLKDAEIQYFNLGVKPIFRETYQLGNYPLTPKGFFITKNCIGCGKCKTVCPQTAIESGRPYKINKVHCLHCGSCAESCPVKAIINY